MSNPVRVLITDDSAVVRHVLSQELSKDPAINVIGTASDPYIARDKIVELQPDVILLDIEMPRMDGLAFLEKLMRYHPMPVIIVSSLAQEGSELALKALELGAVDVIAKPGTAYSVQEITDHLREKIKSVAKVKISPVKRASQGNVVQPSVGKALLRTTDKVIAIGASTGGTEAIKDVLIKLPAHMPPIVIVQHMPEHFTKAFAKRLNELSALDVREAEGGERLIPGMALIAPGNHHMVVKRSGAQYFVEIKDGPPVYHQRPSVEVLFHSMAEYVGANAIGVLLTGMGKDGAQGLLEMRTAGAFTVAQDEESSVVFGMPKEAISLGAAMKVASLADVPRILIDRAQD